MPYFFDCGTDSGGGGGGGSPVIGSMTPFTGTVNTTGADVPAVAGNLILYFGVRCAVDQPVNTRLEFSVDAGSTWFSLKVGEAHVWQPIDCRQIRLRAAGSGITSADYEVIMNRGIT